MEDEVQNNKLQLLGKLAASLAHELRNPLSALKLNLNLLEMSKDSFDSEANESIDACLEAADRMQALIENTLEFSRKSVREREVFNLNELVRQALDILVSTASRKTVLVKTSLQEHVPALNLNKNKILQVLLNLVTNAIEASRQSGTIEVVTLLKADRLLLEVRDHGVGIKNDDKCKIFKDFYTSKERGTGLGLSVCKMLLEEQGAEIYFDSAEDKGTTFTVEFPI